MYLKLNIRSLRSLALPSSVYVLFYDIIYERPYKAFSFEGFSQKGASAVTHVHGNKQRVVIRNTFFGHRMGKKQKGGNKGQSSGHP